MQTAEIKKLIGAKFLVSVLTGAAVVPLIWLTVQSFAKNWRFPALVPPEWSFRAWSYLFDSSAGILSALLSSVLIALIVTITAVALAFPAARAIALHDFKSKGAVLFILLLPIFSPAIVAAVGEHALFLRIGLTDSWVGVVLAHLVPCVPYCVLTLAGSFSRFDVDLEAQAKTLGASRWQILRVVTLPSVAPGVLTAAVFAFLISWSQYLTTLLIGGGKIITLPLILIGFQRSSDEAITAALTLVFLAPTILFVALTAGFWRET